MHRLFAFILLCAALLSGCATPHSIQPTLPEWMQKVPQSTQALYATGTGINLYEAELNARTSLASQIQISITDQLNTRTIVDGNFERDYFDQQTRSRVSDLSLHLAQVVEQAHQGTQWYVLVRLDQQAFIVQLQHQLTEDIQQLQNALRLRDAPSFGRWWRLQQLQAKARRAEQHGLLLEGMNTTLAAGTKATLQNYRRHIQACLPYVQLGIRDHSDIQGLRSVVEAQLSQSPFQYNARSSHPAYIELSSATQTLVLGREQHIKTTLSILLKADSRVLAETSLSEQAITLNKPQHALEKNRSRLLKKANQLNLVQALLNEP